MITTEVEEWLFAALRKKAAKLGGVYIKELGAIPTHLYAAISVEPTITSSELVGELKGYSHEVNRRMGIERRE